MAAPSRPPPLPSSPSSPPPRSATRRLLNRKLLEFPSRREIYRAYGIYVAEKTPRFTPPSCLPRRQEPRPRSTTDLFFSTFFFSLYFFLFFNTPFTANVSLRIKCDSRYISRSNTHTLSLSLLPFIKVYKTDTNRFLPRDPSRSGWRKGNMKKKRKGGLETREILDFHSSLSLFLSSIFPRGRK